MENLLLSELGGQGGLAPVRPRVSLEELDSRVRFLQENSIEDSTRKHYTTGARDYVRFCLLHGLSLEPTPSTLARYIAYSSLFISSGPKYLSGARHFLARAYPDFEKNRSSPQVQAAIAGMRKIRADPIRRKLPLRTCHLHLFEQLARATFAYDDLLFATLISCAFYGCHRMGELVTSNDRTLLDWRKVIKRGSLQFEGGRVSYTLPYHKTDRFYSGTLILFVEQEVANPIALMGEYLQRRDALHGAKAALFLCEDGSLPSRSWFDRRFFKVLDRSFGGHSARAGGATFYAALGISEDVIQALGRWSSQAWKSYIRDNPTVRAEAQLASIRGRGESTRRVSRS
jgi:hypothetical protein